MKFNIEDYLHKIDQAFKEKSKKDKQMIYVMVVFGIFAFAYLLFWDSSFEDFEKTRNDVQSLQKKINQDRQYLQRNPEAVITRLNLEIKHLNQQVEMLRKSNSYIKTKIETISALIYDERKWGEYLDSITTNAQKYRMKIKSFTNRYASNKNAFGHVLDIEVSANGNYQNTLKFINSLEQSDLVVDLHDFNIESAKRGLDSDLNISVWGITY